MTQQEPNETWIIIDNLFLNHYETLMKHLVSYERGKTQSYFRDECVNAVLDELEHLPLSEYIVLKAFEKLDLALDMEKEYQKINKRLKNQHDRTVKKAQDLHEKQNWCVFTPA